MRVAGALTLAAGAMIAVLLAMLPTSISVLGFSGSCGAPAFGILMTDQGNTWSDPLVAQCRSQSASRLGAGLGVAVTAGVAGGLMLLAGRRRPAVPGDVGSTPRAW